MALFKIYTDQRGQYRFFLKRGSKDICFTSTGFPSKFICLKNIESFRQLSVNDRSYLRFVCDSGSPYFKFIQLVSGEIIGQSEFFTNKKMMEDKIEGIKKAAFFAKTDSFIYVA
jgi:uncharacterized protein YegP (UPF0339 family)